jgi:hypothetical protein
LGCKRHKKN